MTYQERLLLAAAAQVALGSIDKRLRGKPIKGRSGDRLEAAARERGITLPPIETDQPQHAA